MKFLAPLLVISWLALSCIKAQTPQFAVVKPNGTTTIYSSWSTAYDGATNDDYIYCPGTSIIANVTIDKRIHLFGAGHHPDSSSVTGKTIIQGQLNITSGANGGSIEGIRITQNVNLGGPNKLKYYTIKRCHFLSSLIFVNTNNDSIPEFCTITESAIHLVTTSNSPYSCRNNLFNKNIFASSSAIQYVNQCSFSNNIFLGLGFILNQSVTNTLFQNNIFVVSQPINTSGNSNICYNSYHNNLKIGSSDFIENPTCPNQGESDNLAVPDIDSIFIAYLNNGFNYTNNYHLKPTCPGVGAGTDGTDLGIYGTNNQTPEGWIPSNPHIYFKQVDSETGPDGKLHIQVGVRANNN